MKTKITLVAAVALSGAFSAVQASPWIVVNDNTKAECSACHTLYAPGFLPKRSWRALMADLPNHFGEDASLDEATRKEIENYLAIEAPEDIRGLDSAVTPLRITEVPWFTRQHNARYRAYAESHPEIGTISNCTGCHLGAERGQFDDD